MIPLGVAGGLVCSGENSLKGTFIDRSDLAEKRNAPPVAAVAVVAFVVVVVVVVVFKVVVVVVFVVAVAVVSPEVEAVVPLLLPSQRPISNLGHLRCVIPLQPAHQPDRQSVPLHLVPHLLGLLSARQCTHHQPIGVEVGEEVKVEIEVSLLLRRWLQSTLRVA